ncbi:MAG: PorV/PorQ family protein, partial [Bacteroidales bacterium]|nr:PorV/PorQ family protein [Bacteroidales bacterium]
MKYLSILTICLLSTIYISNVHAQDDGSTTVIGQEESSLNIIKTTVPFMTIAPDARSSAMGDAGAATSPDVSSQYWNSSKYLFMEEKFGFGLCYTPWLRNLSVADIHLLYLSGYYKLDDIQTVSAAIKYFDLGTINATDNSGNSMGSITPNEFAVDVGYSRKLSDNFGAGLVFRLIHSNITGGVSFTNSAQGEYRPGPSFGADINAYY